MQKIKAIIKKIIQFYFLFSPNKLSKKQIEKIIKGCYPNSKVTIISEIESFQQQMLLLTIKSETNYSKYYFKGFISHMSFWTANQDNLFKRELAAFKILKDTNYKIPDLISSGEKKSVPWTLVRDVEGHDLDSKKVEVNPEKIAKLIAGIHAINFSNNKEELKFLTSFDITYIENQLSKMASICGINPIFIEELSLIVKRFSKTSDLVLCHGDFHLGNIISSSEGHLTLIDFEDVIIGYRQYDIAEMAINLFEDYGDDICQRFLNSYMEISGHSFDKNLLSDMKDFISMRNKIIGIFMLGGGYRHKLPFYTNQKFVHKKKEGLKELEDILNNRRQKINNTD